MKRRKYDVRKIIWKYMFSLRLFKFKDYILTTCCFLVLYIVGKVGNTEGGSREGEEWGGGLNLIVEFDKRKS